MADLYLDPGTGDLYVPDNGVIRMTSGTLETLAQRLRIKLRTFMGEWFLDTTIGVPYYQDILGVKNPDLGIIASIFRRQLLADPDVDSVPRLDVALNSDRSLSVVIDVYGIDRGIEILQAGSNPVVIVSVSTESDPLILFF